MQEELSRAVEQSCCTDRSFASRLPCWMNLLPNLEHSGCPHGRVRSEERRRFREQNDRLEPKRRHVVLVQRFEARKSSDSSRVDQVGLKSREKKDTPRPFTASEKTLVRVRVGSKSTCGAQLSLVWCISSTGKHPEQYRACRTFSPTLDLTCRINIASDRS